MFNSPSNLQTRHNLLLISFQHPTLSAEKHSSQYPNYNPQYHKDYQNQGLLKSHQVKFALAISTITEILSKYKSSKLQTYLFILIKQSKNLRNCLTDRNQTRLQNLQISLETIKLISNYTKSVNSKCFKQLKTSLKITQGLKIVLKLTNCKLYYLKVNFFLKIHSNLINNHSIKDNQRLQDPIKRIIQKEEENMAIKFASTTLIIKAINTKVLLYKLQFCINLNFLYSQKFINTCLEYETIQPNYIKNDEFEAAENNFRAACLLNAVLIKKVQQYLTILKLLKKEDKSRRTSLASSILNQPSMILSKLFKKGESFLDLQQSTNDTELSKLEIDELNNSIRKKQSQTFQDLPQIHINKTKMSGSYKLMNLTSNNNQQQNVKSISISQKHPIIRICIVILLLLLMIKMMY